MSTETSMVLSMGRPAREPVRTWYAEDTHGLVTHYNAAVEDLCATLPPLPSADAADLAEAFKAGSDIGALSLEAPRAATLAWIEKALKAVRQRADILRLIKRDWIAESGRLQKAMVVRSEKLKRHLVKGGFSADAAAVDDDIEYAAMKTALLEVEAANPNAYGNGMERAREMGDALLFIVGKWRTSGVLMAPAWRQAS